MSLVCETLHKKIFFYIFRTVNACEVEMRRSYYGLIWLIYRLLSAALAFFNELLDVRELRKNIVSNADFVFESGVGEEKK